MRNKSKSRITKINNSLKELFPEVRCELDFRNPYEVFIATLLSAQATDVSVNKVTPKFFKKYKNFQELAKAKLSEIEEIIKTIGLYRNKAKNLVASAKIAVERFKGEVPAKIEDLMSLPGIGRKSAVVILSNAFQIAEGIAVDTHVQRIVHRLEIVSAEAKTPEKIEHNLMMLLPREDWTDFSHRVIIFGRRICTARNPKCDTCLINSYCSYEFKSK